MAINKFIGLNSRISSNAINSLSKSKLQNTKVVKNNTTVVVDHATRPVLGNLNNLAKSLTTKQASTSTNPSLQNWSGNVKRGATIIKSPVSFSPEDAPLILSEESGPISCDTFYDLFRMEALPQYNFWTPDETTNDSEELGNRKLEDVPRFIKIGWVPAPELEGTNQFLPKKSKFEKVKQKVPQFNFKGLSFTPDHLKPEKFSMVANSTVNSFLTPAMLTALIEVPDANNVFDMFNDQEFLSDHIDENLFLDHPDTKGINIHDLRSNVFQKENPVINTLSMNADKMSTSGQSLFGSAFAGKGLISKNQGKLVLHSVDPNTPSLSIKSNTSQTNLKPDHALDFAKKVSKSGFFTPSIKIKNIKTTIANSSIPGILSQAQTSGMFKVEHAESIISLSSVMSQLEIMAQTGIQDKDVQSAIERMPSFPSPEGLKPIEYVGYVIEKFKSNSGQFELVETINVPSRELYDYYDTKVLYGEIYRYRIKAILRWTRKNESTPSVNKFSTLNTANINNTSHAAPAAPYKSSYFSTQWSSYSYGTLLDTIPPDPPDEITVIPRSEKKEIWITMKIPNNPQRDIEKMRLYRKLYNKNDEALTGWVQLGTDFPLHNVFYRDTDVEYFENNPIKYIYAGVCISKHNEISLLSEQIEGKITKNYEILGEYPVQFVSSKGVSTEYFGSFASNPPKLTNLEVIIPGEQNESSPFYKFSTTPRLKVSDQVSQDKTYIIRVESLDTGELLDTYINLIHNNMGTSVTRVKNKEDLTRSVKLSSLYDKFFQKS